VNFSRVLSIPLIRCNDQILNGIKRENIDETYYHNDRQSFEIKYKLNLHHQITFDDTILILIYFYMMIYFVVLEYCHYQLIDAGSKD